MVRTTEHKEGKATVKIIYRTAKTLTDGTHPFWLRITKNRNSTFISTGLSLHPKYWNQKHTGYKEGIRKNYPEPYREELIRKLDQWEAKYDNAAKVLAGADELHDSRTVASKAIEERKNLRRSTVLPYIDELTANMKRAGQLGNMQVYHTLKNLLTDFIVAEYKRGTLRFTEITVKFCNDFEVFMREKGNAETSLSNRFRTLRAILNKAISEGIASPETYPFARTVNDRYKFNISKFNLSTRKRAISRDDIRKVEAFVPTGMYIGKWADVKNKAEVERLQRAKNLFLFSFFVGGINFVDMVQLRWQDISLDDDGIKRITYTRQKTGGKFSVRLLKPAQDIIDSYEPSTYNRPESYIFDVLNVRIHDNPKSIVNRLKKVLGQVNADLKIIGDRIGIITPLSSYVARHSMATSLRRSGVADAITGQLMGHRNEKITTVYLDSFASETVDSAMNALL